MDKIIFFAILVVFSFGQLFKIGSVNLLDLLVIILGFYTLSKKYKVPRWYTYFISFLLFGFFSWIFNFFYFASDLSIRNLSLKGIFYLIRLFFYGLIPIYVLNNFKLKKEKNKIVNYLIVLTMFSAIFGWLQYFIFPNTVALKFFGWDDHLFRIIGTFLDPTFLSIILILGSILTIHKKQNILTTFLILSVVFTYSRAGMLVLGLTLLIKRKLVLFLILILIILLSPKMTSEGTSLNRSASLSKKMQNLTESVTLISKSPLIGLGFNNICPAKIKYIKFFDTSSHSCYGLDSSFLFVVATTGVIGLLLLIYTVIKIPSNTILTTSLIAVLIHSIFANSLFYPHVMFWLFTLIGLGTEVETKS